MEHDTLQRRSTASIKNMGVNCYSQIVSAFRAQGDLTEEQLTILPVLQNTLGISRERHTAEIKRALYDEQLSEIATSINPSSETTNWEVEANYNCAPIVHRPPDTKYIRFAEQILQSTPPTTIIQHPPSIITTKLNHDLKQLVHDETKHDGIINATQQQLNNTIKPNFNTTDITGSKVVRLVRAKQATKRKSSLDTLIEVVQKELLRVNGQTNSISPTSSPPSQMRSFKLHNRLSQSTITPHRSIISSVLPSSHPGSLTSQSNHSFKIARKRGIINLNNPKRFSLLQHRSQSFTNDNGDDNNEDLWGADETPSGPENIEEIVRDTVDQLVAITLLKTAPYCVNMLTPISGSGNSTNTESKVLTRTITLNNTSTIKSPSTLPKSDYYRNDLALLSSTANDIRNSIQQTSPIKQQSSVSQQQQIHHSQLIIQPATTTPISTIHGTTTPTLFVAPRILNFQTVVPKPTTNIQIGNTKIILVSPSNITQHLPHSTTPMQPTSASTAHHQQQQSPVKLVKFTTTNNTNTNSITTRSTTLPINPTQTSTLTLPKNVQIVIPSRTHNDDSSKTQPTTTFRPVTTMPMTFKTCAVDQIPQAAQEVTITTSPTSSPPLTTNSADHTQPSSLGTPVNVISSNSRNQLAKNGNSQQQYFPTNSSETNNNNIGSTIGKIRRRSSSSAPADKPMGKILRLITKVLPVYSPDNSNNNHNHAMITDSASSLPTNQPQSSVLNVTTARTSPIHDDKIKSMAVNFQQQPQQIQRPPSTHGPMIYRMTSVNPNVPVFRVRATTAPTSTTIINKTIKTDTKPISVTTTSNMSYESKPAHNTSTTSGSVSVLACFKTTKKRNKERAIMPRPSATDLNDTSNELAQQRMHTSTAPSTSLILTGDISNSNSSSDYRQQISLTPTRLVQQTSLSSTLSDDNPSNMLSSSMHDQINDTTTSSSTSIPITRNHIIDSNSMPTITTPNVSPPMSPLHSTPRLLMEDKCIQCIGNEENSTEHHEIETGDDGQILTSVESKKRHGHDESWTEATDSLLRDFFAQDSFHSLDVSCQQNLTTKFDLLQANLISGALISKDEFYHSVLDIKGKLLVDDLSKSFEDNLDKLFQYFETEFSKLSDETNEQKRIRRE